VFTFNYGYVGSRGTGSVVGPDWKGQTPAGSKAIELVWFCSTQSGPSKAARATVPFVGVILIPLSEDNFLFTSKNFPKGVYYKP
jgi:hypothetical protein